MAQRQFPTLTKRTVDRLSVNDKDTVFWDRDLPGFGVRVYPSGKKVFVVQTRAFGRSKRVSLGEHGDTDFSVDDARRKATEIITRIKTGLPPVPPEPAPAPTVADLADLAERYQREYVEMHCKPLTINHYRLMLRKHIEPALGERLVADVEYKDILAIHNSLHHMPTVANRAADILVKMFNLADAWGWRPSGSNPCRGVPRFRVEKHERFLTREELFRLGEALKAAPTERLASTHAAAAMRLLVLTGCRRNEIPGASLGRPELRHRRDAPPGHQDRHADGAADARRGEGAQRPLPHARQSLGSRARRRAPAWSTSTTPGTGSASAPDLTTSDCTI